MIRIEGLVKRFGNVVAVDGVSFQARNGAITGLLGHNGAGKTTTLRVLYGLLKSDAGQVWVDDIDVAAAPQRAQRHIGVMTDAHGLYPRLTAREHIHYFGRLRGMTKPELTVRTEKLLDDLQMADIADRRAQGFSQGERMKVCLARSLVHDPGNVVMDEPTNGLDVMTTRGVRRLLQGLKAANKCVLLSSHVMQEVAMLCDQLIIVAKGRVCFAGDLDALLRHTGQSSLEDAFVAATGEHS